MNQKYLNGAGVEDLFLIVSYNETYHEAVGEISDPMAKMFLDGFVNDPRWGGGSTEDKYKNFRADVRQKTNI